MSHHSVSEKVNHVRRAAQTRLHACHWPGCSVQVPPAMWGCRLHWKRLPLACQRAIWQAYRPGQEIDGRPSASYVAAALAAQDWIRRQAPQAQLL